VQAVQVPPAAQIGAVAGQVALVRHPTHVPLVEHNVRAGSFNVAHWLDVVQAVQVPLVQTGVAAGQVVLAKHWTHLFMVVSHVGVVPEHVVLSTHCTHAPAAEQTARVRSPSAAHWAEVVQAEHLPAAEQMGTVAGHVALVEHCGGGASGPLGPSRPTLSTPAVSLTMLASPGLSGPVPLSA
jgi:hypothetical protein